MWSGVVLCEACHVMCEVWGGCMLGVVCCVVMWGVCPVYGVSSVCVWCA